MITSMEFLNRHISHIKHHLKTSNEKNRKEAQDHAKAIRTIRTDLIDSFFSCAIDLIQEKEPESNKLREIIAQKVGPAWHRFSLCDSQNLNMIIELFKEIESDS